MHFSLLCELSARRRAMLCPPLSILPRFYGNASSQCPEAPALIQGIMAGSLAPTASIGRALKQSARPAPPARDVFDHEERLARAETARHGTGHLIPDWLFTSEKRNARAPLLRADTYRWSSSVRASTEGPVGLTKLSQSIRDEEIRDAN